MYRPGDENMMCLENTHWTDCEIAKNKNGYWSFCHKSLIFVPPCLYTIGYATSNLPTRTHLKVLSCACSTCRHQANPWKIRIIDTRVKESNPHTLITKQEHLTTILNSKDTEIGNYITGIPTKSWSGTHVSYRMAIHPMNLLTALSAKPVCLPRVTNRWCWLDFAIRK